MPRITAVSPEALIFASNQLAMCLGYSEADGETFRGLNWQDAQGNLYAAASWEASDAWIESTTKPLVRPDWDVNEVIDMDAAEQAQASLVFWVAFSETEAPLASPTNLTAIGGVDGITALTLMGITPYQEQVEQNHLSEEE